MRIVKDGEEGVSHPEKVAYAFIDRSVESKLLAVIARWFSILTPPLFAGALGWLVVTTLGNDKSISIIETKVTSAEQRLLTAENSLGDLRDFIAQSRVVREKDLGDLKQRISTLESQSQTLISSAERQEDKLDKIFDSLVAVSQGK